MWVPLAVLAILATIGGFIGISTAFTGGKHVGGKMNIVNWMDPIIWNPHTGQFGEAHGAESLAEHGASATEATPGATETGHAGSETAGIGPRPSPYGDTGFNLARAIDKVPDSHFGEVVFIIISLAVAVFGMLLGALFYLWRPRLPDVWAARLGPLYRASLNKYWVDEFYGWAITRRTMDFARGVFAFDSKVVDGAVNGSAWVTRLTSRLTGGTDKYFVDGMVNAVAGFVIRIMAPLVRVTQTGFLQNYALVMVIGLLAAVVLFFTGDIVAAIKGSR
jgi:NADH:ubiquinone oxidoreductase subunit 5 (subunit L)/multisubunit Na+/H+ antiporter MnhA subunit